MVGREDILDQLDIAASQRRGREKIQHQGTYNANPVSAAAGVAALDIIERTDPGAGADASAAALRDGLNGVIAAEGLPWAVYGTSSGFHLFLNPEGVPVQPGTFDGTGIDYHHLKAPIGELGRKLRLAMLVQGVDLNPRLGGLLSSAHSAEDVAQTVDAFREAVRMVRAEGEAA